MHMSIPSQMRKAQVTCEGEKGRPLMGEFLGVAGSSLTSSVLGVLGVSKPMLTD